MRPRRQNISYYILATVCALCVFFIQTWIPTVFFWASLLNTDLPFLLFIETTFNIFYGAVWDYPVSVLLVNAGVSLLIGFNIALLVFYWKHYRSKAQGVTSGILGSLVALLGFGCASCGTLFITIVLTSAGATSLSTFPLFSQSYLLQGVGIALLSYSIVVLYKKTNDPLVCKVTLN